MKRPINQFKNKKVLVSGKALPDGGVAVTNWLLENGARVMLVGADNTVRRRIESHLQKIARDGKAYEKLVGRLTDRREADADLTIATSADELRLFCQLWPRKIIGVSGPHGKTTAVVWATHLIGDAIAAGHLPGRSIISSLDSRAHVAVVEVHSGAPLEKQVQTISTEGLKPLEVALAAARSIGTSEELIQRRLDSLPAVPYRQEVVHRDRTTTIINDSTATLPERGVAALAQWGSPNCILIAGGDDTKLDYTVWADVVAQHIRPTNTIFLAGSATDKMRKALGRSRARGIRTYDTLERCWQEALDRAGKYVSAVILFSPAAKSVELFANEFDRGQQFNALVKRDLR